MSVCLQRCTSGWLCCQANFFLPVLSLSVCFRGVNFHISIIHPAMCEKRRKECVLFCLASYWLSDRLRCLAGALMSPRSYVTDTHPAMAWCISLTLCKALNLLLDSSLFISMLCSFCSRLNRWAQLKFSCVWEKKSWRTLTLICPDPPLTSWSVCLPFVFCPRRADGQILMLRDILIGLSRCSLQLVWSVWLSRKGVLYLDVWP